MRNVQTFEVVGLAIARDAFKKHGVTVSEIVRRKLMS